MHKRLSSVVFSVFALISLVHSRLVINAVYSVSFKYSLLGINIFTEWLDVYTNFLASIMDRTFGVYLSGFLAGAAFFLAVHAIALLSENIRKQTWSELKAPVFVAVASTAASELLTILMVEVLKIARELNVLLRYLGSPALFYFSGLVTNVSTIIVLYALISSVYWAVKDRTRWPQMIRFSYILGFWVLALIHLINLVHDLYVFVSICGRNFC